jgi:Tfp pilus assembly protein PilF/spermidine synthase
MAMLPADWAKNAGASVALRGRLNPNIIYEDESRYCHIAVHQSVENPNRRLFFQDTLRHSDILMGNILNLQYSYSRIYAAITKELGKNKEKLNVMVIGGGGYVFPRYIEQLWPGSKIDVAEIDPAVTKAAMEAFGLDKNTTINTIHMDARNYIDKLLEQKRIGKEIPPYDFIYGDAFNDYSVPFQLITREFNDKISAILGNDGLYIINMIDTFDSGLFLGSVINTLEKTFPYVYAAVDNKSRKLRNTFVIIAAKHTLDIKNILSKYKVGELEIWYLSDSDINTLKEKSGHLVLTDNYCPVENLLAPVVLGSAKDFSAEKYFRRAEELKNKGQFAASIKNYLSAMKANPVCSTQSYNEIGVIYGTMGNMEQAVEAFNKAIECNDKAEQKISTAGIHFSLGTAFQGMGKSAQAMKHFNQAIEGFRGEIIENPNNYKSWANLGDALATTGDLKGATEALEKALALNPNEPAYYSNLTRVLEYQGRYKEAIEVVKKFITLMQGYHQNEFVLQLQEHLKYLENQNSHTAPAP